MSGAHVAPTRPERPRGRRPRSPSVSAHGGPRGLFLPRPAPADLLTRASPPCAGPTCLGPRPLHSPTNQPPGPYVPGRPYGDAAVAVAGRDVRKRRQGGTPRRRGVSSFGTSGRGHSENGQWHCRGRGQAQFSSCWAYLPKLPSNAKLGSRSTRPRRRVFVRLWPSPMIPAATHPLPDRKCSLDAYVTSLSAAGSPACGLPCA